LDIASHSVCGSDVCSVNFTKEVDCKCTCCNDLDGLNKSCDHVINSVMVVTLWSIEIEFFDSISLEIEFFYSISPEVWTFLTAYPLKYEFFGSIQMQIGIHKWQVHKFHT
jgi:hypothetical protein